MHNLGKIPCKNSRIASRIISGEAVIVLPSEGYVFALNAIGTTIWRSINGRRSIKEIARTIVGEYNVGEKRAETDVRKFLSELQKRKAVVWKKRRRRIQSRG